MAHRLWRFVRQWVRLAAIGHRLMGWIVRVLAWAVPLGLFLFFREESFVYIHIPPLPWNANPRPIRLYWSFGAVVAVPLVVIWLAFTAGWAWVLSKEEERVRLKEPPPPHLGPT